MVSFIEQHAERCDVCFHDPDLKGEIARITELILPESKIPKAVRHDDEPEVDEVVEEVETHDEGNEEEEEEDYGLDVDDEL
ncbi:hypothetical protein [Desulfotalea psychrophila]|uniref:hypothetical protein n=1 Tax=Desulfotalea psychrophila TaxID=84980 RepID=UPI0002DDE892|nr:hypothetical protein [Desulfotalea psychrophila]